MMAGIQNRLKDAKRSLEVSIDSASPDEKEKTHLHHKSDFDRSLNPQLVYIGNPEYEAELLRQ